MKRSLRPGGGKINIASHKYASVSNPIGLSYSETILAVRKMIIALEKSYLNNVSAALMVLGSQLLYLHFERLVPVTGGVPIELLYEDVQTRIKCLVPTWNSEHSALSEEVSRHEIYDCN